MTDPAHGDDVRRQIQAHLQRLAAAGIDWLPQGPPLEIAPRPVPSPLDDQLS